MFTGLVQARATIREVLDRRLIVDDPRVWPDDPWVLGESIAVSGVCLTLVDFEDGLVFDLSEETLDRTTLGSKTAGCPVNLERAMRIGDRLGGHIVQGHVDGVGRCESIEPQEGGWDFRFSIPAENYPMLIDKGSICIDGISLTLIEPANGSFSVAVIPHTFEVTTLGSLQAGDPVNFEIDVLAKHIAKLHGSSVR